MRLPYLPPIPFMPPSIPIWLSYLLVFAAVLLVVLIIVKILFTYANSVSGAILSIAFIVLFLVAVFLLVRNASGILVGVRRFFGPIF
jgi:hypothetical protein